MNQSWEAIQNLAIYGEIIRKEVSFIISPIPLLALLLSCLEQYSKSCLRSDLSVVLLFMGCRPEILTAVSTGAVDAKKLTSASNLMAPIIFSTLLVYL